MPVTERRKSNDMSEIVTQLALLNERMLAQNEKITSLSVSIDKSVNDHEERIRTLESNRGEVNTKIGEINQRIGVFNLAQASFASAVAFLAYWWKK